jgi:hypothetical protein
MCFNNKFWKELIRVLPLHTNSSDWGSLGRSDTELTEAVSHIIYDTGSFLSREEITTKLT